MIRYFAFGFRGNGGSDDLSLVLCYIDSGSSVGWSLKCTNLFGSHLKDTETCEAFSHSSFILYGKMVFPWCHIAFSCITECFNNNYVYFSCKICLFG